MNLWRSLAHGTGYVVSLLRTYRGLVTVVLLLAGGVSYFVLGKDFGIALIAAGAVAFIQELFQPVSDEMADVKHLHSMHWPVATYPEGRTRNQDYNLHLDEAIKVSQRVYFWGQSGWSHVQRLFRVSPSDLTELRLIIEDPRSDDVINWRYEEKLERIRNGVEKATEDTTTKDTYRQSQIAKTRQLVVELFGMTRGGRHPVVTIALVGSPVNVRIEITDSLVFVSPAMPDRRLKEVYPAIFEYRLNSNPGKLASLMLDQEWQSISHTIELKASVGIEDVTDLLATLGLNPEDLDYHALTVEAQTALSR